MIVIVVKKLMIIKIIIHKREGDIEIFVKKTIGAEGATENVFEQGDENLTTLHIYY